MNDTWHADAAVLERYAGGELDDAQAFSIEAHVLACAACRDALAGAAPSDRLEAIWSGTVDVMDRPRPRPLERVFLRLGIRSGTARLLAATPSLQLSWLLAVSLAVAFAVAAGYASDNGVALFLVVAPLLPVGGVAAAYGQGIDPAYELTLAAPLSGFRLVLLRAVAVLCVSIALAGVAALALPGLDWTAAAWVLPALALTGATLALGTALTPERAAAAVTVAWIFVVMAAWLPDRDRLGAFHSGGQLACAAVAALAAATIVRRRELFEIRRNP